MDPRLRQSMNTYYDERAAEFDEIYTLGKPPGTVTDPELYKEEARSLGKLVGDPLSRQHPRYSLRYGLLASVLRPK